MPVSAPLSIDDSRYSTSRPRKPIYVSIWTEIGVPSLRLRDVLLRIDKWHLDNRRRDGRPRPRRALPDRGRYRRPPSALTSWD